MAISLNRQPLILPYFFDNVSDSDKLLITANARIESYKKNDVILKEGVYADKMLLISSGYCATRIQGRIIGILGPSAAYGSTLTKPTPLVSSLVALGPVISMSIKTDALVKVFSRNPGLVLHFLDKAVSLIKDQMLYQFYIRHILPEVRIAGILWFLGERRVDGSKAIPAVITQDILADMLGLSREEVNKKRKLLVTSRHLYKLEDTWHLSVMTPVLLGG